MEMKRIKALVGRVIRVFVFAFEDGSSQFRVFERFRKERSIWASEAIKKAGKMLRGRSKR